MTEEQKKIEKRIKKQKKMLQNVKTQQSESNQQLQGVNK